MSDSFRQTDREVVQASKTQQESKSSHLKIGCSCSVVQLHFWWAGLSFRHGRRWYIKDSGASIFSAFYPDREERTEAHQAGSQKPATMCERIFDMPLSTPDTQAAENFPNFLTFSSWLSNRSSQSCWWTLLPPTSSCIVNMEHWKVIWEVHGVIKVNKYTRKALRWRWLSWGVYFAFQLCTLTFWGTAFNLHCIFIAFQMPN